MAGRADVREGRCQGGQMPVSLSGGRRSKWSIGDGSKGAIAETQAKPCPATPSPAKPRQATPSQAKPSQAKPSQAPDR